MLQDFDNKGRGICLSLYCFMSLCQDVRRIGVQPYSRFMALGPSQNSRSIMDRLGWKGRRSLNT